METPEKAEEPKLTAGGLAELVGLGMGIPVPASVEIDMEKKQLIAEFEANNFVRVHDHRPTQRSHTGALSDTLSLILCLSLSFSRARSKSTGTRATWTRKQGSTS